MQHLTLPLALAALILALAFIRQARRLRIDPAYGCLTRRGLEARWTGRGAVIFLDIDDMHGLNARHGMSAIDARIAGALRESCRQGEVVAARWASGDELVIWLARPELATFVRPRIERAFASRGMTAMYGIAAAGPDLAATVNHAAAIVQAQKAARDAAERRAA